MLVSRNASLWGEFHEFCRATRTKSTDTDKSDESRKLKKTVAGMLAMLLGGKRRIKAKQVLLYIPDGVDIVVETPPACTACNKAPPSARNPIGVQQPAVTGAPPLALKMRTRRHEQPARTPFYDITSDLDIRTWNFVEIKMHKQSEVQFSY